MVQASTNELLLNGVGNPFPDFLALSNRVSFCHSVIVGANVDRALNPLRLNFRPLCFNRCWQCWHCCLKSMIGGKGTRGQGEFLRVAHIFL